MTNENNNSNGYAYVDLGLPSGTLWATCNVGANKPEDRGDYYAWGETKLKKPNVPYYWKSYRYAKNNRDELTKYCSRYDHGHNGFTDHLIILLPKDDVATVKWGREWCMPTTEQWEELMNNTTKKWTTQEGVKGLLFSASNGNSLFLPIGGLRDKEKLVDDKEEGYYWSRLLNPNFPNYAFGFYFNMGSSYVYIYSRYYGFLVRPVLKKSSRNSAENVKL